MALMLWVAIYVKFIVDLLTWVNNTFGWDFKGNLAYYAPYAEFYPSQQTRLLEFWDKIGLPHDKPKQTWGTQLVILGIGNHWTLKEYQHLAGWINWSLNGPGLSVLYEKMAGKTESVRESLWFIKKVDVLSGVRMLDSEEWGFEEADIVLYCDACPTGMGFWFHYDDKTLGYQCMIPDDHEKPIFYFEVLTVVSAILHTIKLLFVHGVFVFTDTTNTVDMFHSLKAKQLYNPLLLTMVDHAICSNIQFRVAHICGEENGIADALSWFDYTRLMRLAPSMNIYNFTPPHSCWGQNSYEFTASLLQTAGS
ncbi:hypothetical protein F5879DRAFT_1012909 [Lentinula edodes]|uniref:uncharacterized protein n=1 Tax=Lentinula edodes TaxID=5353 RepID=UPI001E8E0F55|nr:uncharacterized protein C8R40DRAFT_1164164 [Lentinula edodes]KAH7867948.1 hypothetical protein C8R40DRAFT_1164164 [Lentinula edodes]KAJ3897424.1 hypothetical protein F5879DRAFT_1012909 [Lentinula edodes]KAJ3911252.1 hypothetical protein F5877DRAFT_93809 [Lentinula edodes]